MSVIYIAGPMSGRPDKGRAAFAAAQEWLRRRYGWIVLNPALLPDDLPAHSYMPVCLQMLNQAEAVGLLPGWRGSPGAVLERDFARYQGIRVIDLEQDLGYDEEEALADGNETDDTAAAEPRGDRRVQRPDGLHVADPLGEWDAGEEAAREHSDRLA